MLSLARPTEADWAARALPHVDALLLEQAHLEKKAAATALRFLFRYPQHAALQRPLSELAREELEHFELCLEHLARRGVAFGPQESSGYARELLEAARPTEPDLLLDRLLCCAMIEARSCERMRLLADAVAPSDAELAEFYRGLLACEARHHGLYLQLARELFPDRDVRGRLAELARAEAEAAHRTGAVPRFHR